MARGFAAGAHAVVATGAGAQHLRMIHGSRRHRFPGCGTHFMTVVAEIGGIDMGCRLGMAGTANTSHLGMVHTVG